MNFEYASHKRALKRLFEYFMALFLTSLTNIDLTFHETLKFMAQKLT